MRRALVTAVALCAALAPCTFATLACTREIVVLDSLSDDYCPADSSPDGTVGCEGGMCPATPSCAIDRGQ
jgi:hypothetical protein